MIIFLLLSSVSGCASEPDFDTQLRDITEPYRFNLAKWEFNAIIGEIEKLFTRNDENTDNASATFFTNVGRIRQLESLIKAVEAAPDGAVVARLAGRRLTRGERDDTLALTPLYLKESTAKAFTNKYRNIRTKDL